MPEESIVDTSRPNAGRIYDYMLGGSHNFEVDRAAAEQIVKLIPFLPKLSRLQRWCLQDIAVELTKKYGLDVIIDFASGLPTNDHIHHVVPPGTTVIYSDYDPIVVEYANEILQEENLPNVHIFQADARRPEELLERLEVEQVLAGRRRVGFVLWGVALFLDDESLVHAADYLYHWSSPDSVWAFNAQGTGEINTSTAQEVADIYARMGTPPRVRSLDTYRRLIQPWRIDGPDFVSLMDWHGFDPQQLEMSASDLQIYGEQGGNFGAYLVK
jgi:hypothetical protein